jgi:hypothetical protein
VVIIYTTPRVMVNYATQRVVVNYYVTTCAIANYATLGMVVDTPPPTLAGVQCSVWNSVIT